MAVHGPGARRSVSAVQDRTASGPRGPVDAEARLAAYFAGYASDGGRKNLLGHLVRHPVAGVQALHDLRALPVLHVDLGAHLEGGLVSEALPPTVRGPRSVAAALTLPATGVEYSSGSSRQTLRRKVRAAERAGVTWSTVTDPDEKRVLLDLAHEYERMHPLEQYRKAPPEGSHLLQVDLWQLARGADGRPLVLSITPVDGRSALLGMFRTFEISDEASDARYLMTKVLAEQLIGRGVTHLFDGVHPAHLSNGLRHFQRMVGFRLVRIAQRPTSTTPAPADGVARSRSGPA